MAITLEKQETATVTYLGRLKDLGLGNPDGIPTELADANAAELQEFGEMLKTLLVPIADETHLSCIDGRHVSCNHDGSKPEARYRHVSGTGSNFEIARNAGAPIVASTVDMALGDAVLTVEESMSAKTGFKRSAHLGGCGGVNGAVQDNQEISDVPAVLAATEALMSIPEVVSDLATEYSSVLADTVHDNANATAKVLIEGGWTGDKYVQGVCKDEPAGVEDLESDPEHPFHGHSENAIVIILGKKTIVIDNLFVINLEVVKRNALALSAPESTESYTRAIIAGIAKHMAVANRLPGEKMPVYLIAA